MRQKKICQAILLVTVAFVLIQLYLWTRLPVDEVVGYGSIAHLENFVQNPRKRRIAEELGSCGQGNSSEPCCFPWDYNADSWWIHHPDWEVRFENQTSFCFSPIRDVDKAELFRKVYQMQWHGNCSAVLQAYQINAGYAASLNQIIYAFITAVDQGRPYQYVKHRPQMTWFFAPKNETSWAFCTEMDMNCYFLPLSNCSKEIGRKDEYPAERPRGKERVRQFQWLRQYATRPLQHVRKKVYDTIQELFPPVLTPCTAMHVRRGDVGFVKFPWRRYAAVQEYLDKAKVQEGENVVLLTDDESTIEEVKQYHPNYNWIYMNRTRDHGTDNGFNSHIPSGDPAFEVVAIMAEVSVASECNKLVHGHSGFVTTIRDAMDAAGRNYTTYYVETKVKEAVAKIEKNKNATLRAKRMWGEIEALNQGNTTDISQRESPKK